MPEVLRRAVPALSRGPSNRKSADERIHIVLVSGLRVCVCVRVCIEFEGFGLGSKG